MQQEKPCPLGYYLDSASVSKLWLWVKTILVPQMLLLERQYPKLGILFENMKLAFYVPVPQQLLFCYNSLSLHMTPCLQQATRETKAAC